MFCDKSATTTTHNMPSVNSNEFEIPAPSAALDCRVLEAAAVTLKGHRRRPQLCLVLQVAAAVAVLILVAVLCTRTPAPRTEDAFIESSQSIALASNASQEIEFAEDFILTDEWLIADTIIRQWENDMADGMTTNSSFLTAANAPLTDDITSDFANLSDNMLDLELRAFSEP